MRTRWAFSLFEILVASTLLLLVLGVALAALWTSGRASSGGLEKLDEVGKLTRLAEFFKRPLRFATQVIHTRPAPDREEFRIAFVDQLSPADGSMTQQSAVIGLRGSADGPRQVDADFGGHTQSLTFDRLQADLTVAGSLISVSLQGTGKRRLQVCVASPYSVTLTSTDPAAAPPPAPAAASSAQAVSDSFRAVFAPQSAPAQPPAPSRRSPRIAPARAQEPVRQPDGLSSRAPASPRPAPRAEKLPSVDGAQSLDRAF